VILGMTLSFLSSFQQAALVLNASCRFRYTLDLEREEEKENLKGMIRAHAQVIRAVFLFKEAGQKNLGGTTFNILLLSLTEDSTIL